MTLKAIWSVGLDISANPENVANYVGMHEDMTAVLSGLEESNKVDLK